MAQSHDDIQKLYIGITGRPADPAGIAYWENSNLTMPQIVDHFIYATPAMNSMSTMQKFSTLYTNLFDRPADFAGLMYWTNQVNTAKVTMGEATIAFITAAKSSDLFALGNKIYAANLFGAHIDTSNELIAYGYGNNMATVLQIANSWLSKVGATYASVDNAIKTVDATLSSIVSAAGLGFAADQQNLSDIQFTEFASYDFDDSALYGPDVVAAETISLIGSANAGDNAQTNFSDGILMM